MTQRALLLTPSRGAGGGIERYAEAVESAFAEQCIWYRRIDLDGPGSLAHARMLGKARKLLRASSCPIRLILAHRLLLPAASLLARERSFGGMSVVCHGTDVWGYRPTAQRFVESRLMRGSTVRVVAVSSFTAGSLACYGNAFVLPPGLSRRWFDTLVAESRCAPRRTSEFRLVTAFRLSQWRDKGLPELLASVAALDRSDVRVVVCGSGRPSPELQCLVAQHPWCSLKPGITDRELARQLAEADLFVLATRTTGGRRPSGEGFGLVLLEAQVAGTAVVGPAYGGSRDAYIDGVTGRTPADESSAALTKVVADLLCDKAALTQMGKQAAEWARESFSPDRYAVQAVASLL